MINEVRERKPKETQQPILSGKKDIRGKKGRKKVKETNKARKKGRKKDRQTYREKDRKKQARKTESNISTNERLR